MFRIPMRRTRSPCCALVATGHTTAPPHNAMKSRRLIKTPEAQTRNGSNLHTYSGRGTTLRMSALGRKCAYATQKPMSALGGHPLRATIPSIQSISDCAAGDASPTNVRSGRRRVGRSWCFLSFVGKAKHHLLGGKSGDGKAADRL